MRTMFSSPSPPAPLPPANPGDVTSSDQALQDAIAYRNQQARARRGRDALVIPAPGSPSSTGLSIL